MNIQIPESALEPFGVLGIPKLCNDNLKNINDALDEAIESINLFENHNYKPLPLGIVRGYIRQCLEDMGVDPTTVRVYTDAGSTECEVTILHSPKNIHDLRRYRRYGAVVRSKTGFK